MDEMSACAPSTSSASDERPVRPQSAHSPNFNYLSAGNEAEKLKWLALHHVRPSGLKRMFAPLMLKKRRTVNRSDELACVEACMLMRALEPSDKTKPPTELEQACYSLVGLLSTEKTYLNALDRIITRIILTAHEEKIISLLLTCQLLVSSIDFRMKLPLNPEKIKFVRKSMDQLDYKNMRDLLKLLLMEKLDKMQCQLTEHQHKQLAPIEALVIDLIDRSKNYCPALFFITEISRIDPCHSSIHFLPRISLKIREMVSSFRPLAEIGSMLGRSWMWPVPASPCFSWSSQTWSAWKLDEKQCKLYFKTHLPYSSENTTPQTYLQYILFKQPHGQDNLNHILRSPSSQTPAPRIQCDEVIQLLILEAMCAMEDSDQPVLAPINQYNWLHLSHLVTHALLMQNCTLSDLLKMLLPQLRSCQYLRAKEELMWILLQLVAHARSRENSLANQQQSGQSATASGQIPSAAGLSAQNQELVLEIFNVLYTEKIMNSATTCSTENPLNMVRFFAPAAIWINLVHSVTPPPSANSTDQQQPQPPEKLKKRIDFIEQQLDPNKPLDKTLALLAVIANAYSNSKEIFEEHVSSAVLRILGYHVHHQQGMPVHQPEKYWTLPSGRRTEQNLRALDLTFLDSLTFHAKMRIFQSIIRRVFAPLFTTGVTPNFATLRLPTPALVESTARLLLSTELIDLNGTFFYSYICKALKYANIIPTTLPEQQIYFARNDLLAMFLELLNFRLQNIGFGWKWTIDSRVQFIYQVMESLHKTHLSASPCPSSNSLQLCALLEQTVTRFVQCTWPQDLLSTVQMLAKMLPDWMGAMPELCRLFHLAVLRSAKLLGAEQLQLGVAELGRRWPRSALRWFPANILNAIVPSSDKELAQMEQVQAAQQTQAIMELHNISNQEMQRLLHLDAEYFGLDAPSHPAPPSLLISIFRCLHEYPTVHPQLPPGKQPHPSTPNFLSLCYKLLSLQSNRDLHMSTNTLVGYLIWKCQGGAQQGPQPMDDTFSLQQLDLRMVAILNDMLFVHQFITVERFLLSLALHPSDDSSIRASLYLLAVLLDKFPSFSDRLRACFDFAPAHSHTTSSNSEEMFAQMAEFYKKYPEYTYSELHRKSTMDPTYQQAQQEQPLNLPIYYGHLADRILPIVDVIFQRALEVQVVPGVLEILLRHFAHLYRLHPQPMGFLYKTLFTLDNSAHRDLTGYHIIRKFVLDIVTKLEQEEAGGHANRSGHQYKLLTAEFVQQDHNMPPVKLCRVLVERIVQASTYTHQPPPFIQRDWRFSEYPPAGQALTSAWVELLVTKHSPSAIVDALVELAIQRPISRPQDTLNTLGLLLTGLPSSFQLVFLDRIEESFDWPQIASPDTDPSQLFESLSHEVYLHSDSRILSMLALIHSFCQHGGNNSLSIIPDLVVNRLAQKVENEAQLLYFLRIVVPYLQRIHEKERSKHMPEIVAIYTVLGNLVQKVGRLQYEDTICDLLYQFKYMFVGYYLKDQTELAIRNFPDSMREKLKFLLTHSSTAAAAESQQQMQQILLQQQQQQHLFQQLHHQSSQGSLSSVPATAGVLPPGGHPPLLQHQQIVAAPGHLPAGLNFPFDPSHQQQQQPAALLGMLQRQQSRAEDGAQPPIDSQQNQQQMGPTMVPPPPPMSSSISPSLVPFPVTSSASSNNIESPSITNPHSHYQQSQQIVPPPPPYQMHPMMMAHPGTSVPSQMSSPFTTSSSSLQQQQHLMHSNPQQHMTEATQYQQHQMTQQQQLSSFGPPSSSNNSGSSPGNFFPMGFPPPPQQVLSSHQQMGPIEHSSSVGGGMTPQQQQPSQFPQQFPPSSGNYQQGL